MLFPTQISIFALAVAATSDTEHTCQLQRGVVNSDGSVQLNADDALLQLALSTKSMNLEAATAAIVADATFTDDSHKACADLSWSQKVFNQLGSTSTTFLCHQYLGIAYSHALRNPLLVAFDLEPHEQVLNLGGRKNFVNDPSLAALDKDFTRAASSCFGPQGNGDSWDRGHLAPSYAFTWKTEALEETYYMSNAAPQAAQFNRVAWRLMEEHLTDYVVCKQSSLLVVVGTAYDYPWSAEMPKIDGTAIPSHFWIAVCNAVTKQSAAKYGRNTNDNYPVGMDEFISVDALLEQSFMHGSGLTDIFGGYCDSGSLLDLGDRQDMDKCSDALRDEALDGIKGDDATDAALTCALEEDGGGKLVLWKYLEGKSWNKGVVVKNVGDDTVSLKDYYLKLAVNGKPWSNAKIELHTRSTDALGAGEELVILHSNADSSSQNVEWLKESRPAGSPEDVRTGSLKFTGDDAVGLFNCDDDNLKDQIGEPDKQVKVFKASAGDTKDDRLQRSFSTSSGCVEEWDDGCSKQWEALGLKR